MRVDRLDLGQELGEHRGLYHVTQRGHESSRAEPLVLYWISHCVPFFLPSAAIFFGSERLCQHLTPNKTPGANQWPPLSWLACLTKQFTPNIPSLLSQKFNRCVTSTNDVIIPPMPIWPIISMDSHIISGAVFEYYHFKYVFSAHVLKLAIVALRMRHKGGWMHPTVLTRKSFAWHRLPSLTFLFLFKSSLHDSWHIPISFKFLELLLEYSRSCHH